MNATTAFVEYKHELNLEENHEHACQELCRRIAKRNQEKYGSEVTPGKGWLAPMVGGQLLDGSYAWVFLP